MSSTLKYRLPGAKSVSLQGSFQKITNEVPEGFVVSNFEGSEIFKFSEVTNNEEGEHVKPHVATREAYLEVANELIADLKDTEGKVVFSRIQADSFKVDINEFYDALCDSYPGAFVYLIQSKLLGTWIGATPETLIAREGNSLRSMALAGTRRSGEDKEWTDKEFEEHEFVADFIEQKVKSFNPKEFSRSKRTEATSGPVRHLRTDFQWQTPESIDWAIARKLHPTPAVSGLPVDTAIQKIKRFELHNRGLYTGIIGLVGGETRLFVNLRCAQIIDDEVYLYLGGGFTKDSIAEDEWNETENKAATLRNVLKKI